MLHRKTDRKNLQGEETRNRILEETMRLVARHGYAGTSLTMVRKASGVSASSVYWHFSDKDQLIAAALEHAYRAQARSLPNWLDTLPGALRRADLFTELMRSPKSDSAMEYWRFGLQLAVVRPQTEIPARDRFLQIRRESIEWLGQWWERTFPVDMEQKRAAALLLGQFTVSMRESEFLKLHGNWQLDDHRLTWMVAACLDEVANRTSELVSERFIESVRELDPQPEDPAPSGGREILVQAAKEVIMEFGYDGVTIARVCEKARLPASSLYWSFKDKDELISTVIAAACSKWGEARHRTEPLPADGDWSRIVRAHILPTMRNSANESGLLSLGLLLLLQRADAVHQGRRDLELVMQDTYDFTVDWFRQVLALAPKEGPDADLPVYLTECLFRLLDGILLSRQIDERPWDPEFLADLISTALYRVAQTARDDKLILGREGQAEPEPIIGWHPSQQQRSSAAQPIS
ncbi:TetR/AcrR family transcriptional regulator [Pseudarthrobacter sp. H2]|uniref:TetR/AcrR family transcriptional regulator n=1 Tax=Pseudarthrobacter sp. H2 TaxID=3418415 RepID=UPI003CE7AE19